MWSDAVIASIGNRQEAKPETHFQTWSISAAANLQIITDVKAIFVPTETGKKVLTMTPDIWRMLFFIALGVILRLIW